MRREMTGRETFKKLVGKTVVLEGRNGAATTAGYPGSFPITFTLGELLKAISEEVQPGEDPLVAEVLLDLIDSGRIKPVGPVGESTASLLLALSDDSLC
jgi:hypothetical protein